MGPPAPAGLADRALAAATAAWRDRDTADGPAATAPPPRRAESWRPGDHRVEDDIVPLRRRPPAPSPVRVADRQRVPRWALGAVAAVVAVLLAVPFALGGEDSGGRTASAPADDAATGAALDEGALAGGELGALADDGTLREELLAAVPGAAAAAEARTEQAAPTPDDAAGGARPGAPSPEAFAAGTTAAAPGAADPGAAGGDAPCRAEIRGQLGDRLGPLLYTATLRWQGTDAVVLAYRLADTSAPGADHLAFVMARDDCRVLTSQGF